MSPYTLHKAKFCRKSGPTREGMKLGWKDTGQHLSEHTWVSELTTRKKPKEDLQRSLSSGEFYVLSKKQLKNSSHINLEELKDLGFNSFSVI